MSVPVATERKSFLPLRSGSVGPRLTTISMPSVSENNNKSSLTVGSRVLVNGQKSGTLRYSGVVQFAQGLFCGVELDQPEGKHDGEVKDIRYFQCPPNHGVFVPRDKVVLESRIRASSSQRPVSRLKPPTITRSITITSSINRIEPSKAVQLPDIVPNSTPQPVTLNESIITDPQEILLSTELVTTIIPDIPLPPLVDEPPETIEADFTDSVSLILRQLQQEDKPDRRTSSITISEEETDDDDDEIDTESVVESTIDQTRRSSISSSVFIPIEQTKSIQTDLSFHVHDQISFNKVIPSAPTERKKSLIQPVKKTVIEKRPIPPANNPPKRTITRKPAIVPAKKATVIKSQQNPVQSKSSLSLSSCNSLNSSQSDVASMNKTTKQISDKSQLTNLSSASSEKERDESHALLITLNESLQINNQKLKTYYQHLLRQFDLMLIINQYYLQENEQIKGQHQRQLSKGRIRNERLQNSIKHLRSSHINEISSLNQQYQNQIELLHKTHGEQLNETQHKIDHLLHEKSDLESRCSTLQEKVDGFLTEMANSEHADVLLCHVETLEKDRTSLQTVLELKYKEITQLRTKLNEQQIKLSDEQALQKRIIMAENRIQDLEWLLREKQLSEKTAVIERDELKERTSQLERDHGQLKFENETLRYRLCEHSLSTSFTIDKPIESIPLPPSSPPPRKERIRNNRSSSFSSSQNMTHENERLTRSSSSLNGCL